VKQIKRILFSNLLINFVSQLLEYYTIFIVFIVLQYYNITIFKRLNNDISKTYANYLFSILKIQLQVFPNFITDSIFSFIIHY
jgi:hypothetical protein